MSEVFLETVGLSKRFKDVKAVDNLSISVNKGDVYGFLGPNGAGKTTSIKMVLGLTRPTHGTIIINGETMGNCWRDIRRDIGYLPERTEFYRNLTAIQTLRFFTKLRGGSLEKCDDILANVGLEEWRDKKVGTFSKGMVQLVAVAQAISGDPSILIMDEPTSGLDPRWSRKIKDIIKEMNSRGVSIVFSSHLLYEVQELCNRVAIMNRGKLIIQDDTAKVSMNMDIKPRIIMILENPSEKAMRALTEKGFDNAFLQGNKITIVCDPARRSEVIAIMSSSGFIIKDIRTEDATLEDAFLKLVGSEAVTGGAKI